MTAHRVTARLRELLSAVAPAPWHVWPDGHCSEIVNADGEYIAAGIGEAPARLAVGLRNHGNELVAVAEAAIALLDYQTKGEPFFPEWEAKFGALTDAVDELGKEQP